MTEVSVEQLKAKVKSASRSAVVTIVNNTPNTLAREPLQPPMHGEFVWPPAEQIAPGARASFALASKGFMIGTGAPAATAGAGSPARLTRAQRRWSRTAIRRGRSSASCSFTSRRRTLARTKRSAHRRRARTRRACATRARCGRRARGRGARGSACAQGHLFECTFSVTFDAASDVPSRHSSVRSAASLCAESDSGAGSDAASGGGLVSPRVDSTPRSCSVRCRAAHARLAVESDDWKIELKRAVRSVLVAINNRTSSTLVRQSLAIRHGIWRRPPPGASLHSFAAPLPVYLSV